MSLFIVNFHWQTYSYNISFQAQRLERLRKERQNQIKCKNVQWKDRNTSYSGKKIYFTFNVIFMFDICLQNIQFVIFTCTSQAYGKYQFITMTFFLPPLPPVVCFPIDIWLQFPWPHSFSALTNTRWFTLTKRK